jgi:tetratricopeptide (TPR) repeat protein
MEEEMRRLGSRLMAIGVAMVMGGVVPAVALARLHDMPTSYDLQQLAQEDDVSIALNARGVLARLGVFEGTAGCVNKALRRSRHGNDAASREELAGRLADKGWLAYQKGRFSEVILIGDMINRRFGKDDNLCVREAVAVALNNKAEALAMQSRFDEAVTVFDEIDRRFNKDVSLPVRRVVAEALINKGVKLYVYSMSIEEYQKAIAVFDEVERRFGKEDSTVMQLARARAYVLVGMAMSVRAYNWQEARKRFDEVGQRFNRVNDARIREFVVAALVGKAKFISNARREDFIALCDDIDRQFGQDDDPFVLAEVIRSLILKGNRLIENAYIVTLQESGNTFSINQDALREGFAIYDEIVERYGENVHPVVRYMVVSALKVKNRWLFRHGDFNASTAVLDEIERRYGKDDNPWMQQVFAGVLADKSYIFLTQKKWAQALAVCDEIERRFGESAIPGVRWGTLAALFVKFGVFFEIEELEKASKVKTEIKQRFENRLSAHYTDSPYPDFSYFVNCVFTNLCIPSISWPKYWLEPKE